MKKFLKRLLLRVQLHELQTMMLHAMHEYQQCHDPHYLIVIRMFNIKIIRMKKELKMPFKIKFSEPIPFRKGDIIRSAMMGYDGIVIKTYKTTWFKKLLFRLFGKPYFTGVKVKKYG